MAGRFEQKRMEQELKSFVITHFVKPPACRRAPQISSYIPELYLKIGVRMKRFNYTPAWVYSLLGQYNSIQTRILPVDFKNSYC
jgi:hypothetical protein